MTRKRTLLHFTVLGVVLLLMSGCASSIMTKTEPMSLENSDKALVTFVRPSIFGGAIQFGLWDTDNFIGVLSAKSSVQYLAEPGEHLFLARAENWSYVKADLAAGKEYFIVGRVFPGIWKARVALDPVTQGDEADIQSWRSGLTPVMIIPEEYDDYVTPRVAQVKEAVVEYEQGNVEYEVMNKEDGR